MFEISIFGIGVAQIIIAPVGKSDLRQYIALALYIDYILDNRSNLIGWIQCIAHIFCINQECNLFFHHHSFLVLSNDSCAQGCSPVSL